MQGVIVKMQEEWDLFSGRIFLYHHMQNGSRINDSTFSCSDSTVYKVDQCVMLTTHLFVVPMHIFLYSLYSIAILEL